MEKYQDKIIVYKNTDREIFMLLENMSTVKYGIIKFDNKNLEEIKMKNKKPYQIITIRESILLNDEIKDSGNYGD